MCAQRDGASRKCLWAASRTQVAGTAHLRKSKKEDPIEVQEIPGNGAPCHEDAHEVMGDKLRPIAIDDGIEQVLDLKGAHRDAQRHKPR